MQTLSIDAGLLRSLSERPWRGRVHSVFERVINLQHDDGALVTLASRDLDNAPATLRLDVAGFAGAGLAAGDHVTITDQRIAIGSVEMRIDGAASWQTLLPAWTPETTRLRRNLAELRAVPAAALRAKNAHHTASALDISVAQALQQRAALLCDALRHGDGEAACAFARDLIGFGPGLTPSGDDFLVGLFVVLHLPGSPAPCPTDFCEAVMAGIESRTNAISAAALKAAARGQVRECIQGLLRALMTGTPQSLRTALAQVLAIGSSSGADIVAGMLSGFDLILAAELDSAGAP